MILSDVVTPSFIHNLQSILSLGLKPDSFNAESALARSLPNAKRLGGNSTLIDVLVKEPIKVGIELKCTASIKTYKKDRPNCLEHNNSWFFIPKSTLIITRRPDVDCFSDIDPKEGLMHSVNRLDKFYQTSKEKEDCKEIYSLLVQHNWKEGKDFTVFDFSLGKFSIPEIKEAKKVNNTFEGYDSSGDLCLLHNSFTRGSQNFSKKYYVYDDHLTVIINHAGCDSQSISWKDLHDVKIYS